MENILVIILVISIYILIGVAIFLFNRLFNSYYMKDLEIPAILLWPINLIFVSSGALGSIKKQFKEYFELLGLTRRFK